MRLIVGVATALAVLSLAECSGAEFYSQPGAILELRRGTTASDVATLQATLLSDKRVESVEYLSPGQMGEEVRSFEDSPSSPGALNRIRNAPPTVRVTLRRGAHDDDREAVLAIARRPEFAALLAHPQEPEFGFGP